MLHLLIRVISIAILFVEILLRSTFAQDVNPLSVHDSYLTDGPVLSGILTSTGSGIGLGWATGASRWARPLAEISAEILFVDVHSQQDSSKYSIRNGIDIGLTGAIYSRIIDRETVIITGFGIMYRLSSKSIDRSLWYIDRLSTQVLIGIDRQFADRISAGLVMNTWLPLIVTTSKEDSRWLPFGYQWRYGVRVHIGLYFW